MIALKQNQYGFIYFLLKTNYYLALLITFVFAILGLMNSEFPFHINTDLYGPIANNLKLMLLYLFVAEFSVFGFCSMAHNYKALTVLGLFLVLLIGALEFYGHVNHMSIDENYHIFFLYTGISHILFGTLSFIRESE